MTNLVCFIQYFECCEYSALVSSSSAVTERATVEGRVHRFGQRPTMLLTENDLQSDDGSFCMLNLTWVKIYDSEDDIFEHYNLLGCDAV
jgi:hypothetical protein